MEDDDTPFEPGKEICSRCHCAMHEQPKSSHYLVDCSSKDMHNVPTEWPTIEGSSGKTKLLPTINAQNYHLNLPDIIIVASFSGNEINTLHRLPQTDNFIFFSCRHCELKVIEVDAFLDVPKILRLDLSWNELTGETLRSDTFRGRFNTKYYEPIALEELNLSHNRIRSLERKIFEHLPRLKTLSLAHNPLVELDPMTTGALCSLPTIEVIRR